ncbi:hypothetical protein ACFVQ4_24925 [Streptomyces laurentii]|uniref:hypothetical protein n=1 Tax=Streptomyces laurentii TaxID=39478 RepID=UPI0036C8A458
MPFQPWQPGMTITSGGLQSISPTWQPWTPTWTTATGAPSYGNATVDCAYAVAARTVWFRFEIAFGSTTTYGGNGDNWTFGLPIPAASTVFALGWAELGMTNGARCMSRIRVGGSTSTLQFEISSGRVDGAAITSTGIIDSLSPWTWGNGGSIRGTGCYESAT